jgi:hypothetical protein
MTIAVRATEWWWCCDELRRRVTDQCDSREHYYGTCPDQVVVASVRNDSQRWVGLPIHDGGNSFIVIRFCPWCGADVHS